MPRLTLLLALVLSSTPLAAQTRNAMTDDQRAALAVVERMFNAMRAKDTAALRSTFHATARLQSAGPNQAGEPMVSETPIDRFIQIVGGTAAYLDEQIWDAEVRVDGALATVWTKYAFYADRQFSHCGVDAFQLGRVADGWKIFQVADTRRREGCELPPGEP